MNALTRRIAAAAALLLLPLPAAAQQPPAVAFVDVSVVPMDSQRVLRRQTVVVRDGRIESLGPAASAAVPEDALRVDGRGRWLVPGLAEMHGHVPHQAGAWRDDVLFLFLANGVTLVRGMQGHPSHIELREALARGDVLGPTLVAGSPPLHGGSATDPQTAAALVSAHAAAGYDLLKVHEGLSAETYDAIAASARRAGLTWGGHVADAVGLRAALAAGQATVDHLDGYLEALAEVETGERGIEPVGAGDRWLRRVDTGRIPELARATRAAGTGVVPTMALWETLFGTMEVEALLERQELRYVPAATRRQWASAARGLREQTDAATAELMFAVRPELLKGLADGGAEILLGTDAPQLFSVPGFSVHREVAEMSAAGLTPWQILVAATRAPAEHLGMGDERGTIAVGLRADLVLLDADPLADVAALRRVTGVMKDGRWLPGAEIRERLERIAARNARAPE